MSIIYRKLFALMDKMGKRKSDLKKDKVIGNATFDKMDRGHGFINTRSINNICKYLNCQPGDIMEYIPDDDPPAQ